MASGNTQLWCLARVAREPPRPTLFFRTHARSMVQADLSAETLEELLYWPWAEYRVLRDAAAVLFTSEEERRLAREFSLLYRCKEVVVNYGTAAPALDLETRARFPPGFSETPQAAFSSLLGRLHVKKGCDLLIEAFAALRNSSDGNAPLHLVLAGPCADEEYLLHLKRLAAAVTKDDGSITFTGMLSGNRKWGAFSAADAFVLPSHQENFGIAVVEALACGTPVLISTR